jgi:hypothetical protein
MKLYQFNIAVQDGKSEYLLRELVAASTDRLAACFAHRWALNFRPGAEFNSIQNLFYAPEGSPIWRVSSIRELSELTVPCADNGKVVKFDLQPRAGRKKKKHPAK